MAIISGYNLFFSLTIFIIMQLSSTEIENSQCVHVKYGMYFINETGLFIFLRVRSIKKTFSWEKWFLYACTTCTHWIFCVYSLSVEYVFFKS